MVQKVGPVIPAHGTLLVCPENGRLQIWGLTDASVGGGISGVAVEIAAPGIVRLNIHMLRPYVVFREGTAFFLEGAAPVGLPDYLRKAMRKHLPDDDIIALHQAWHECIVLGMLAMMILEQGHGGTILVVREVDGNWRDSINPFAFRFATPITTAQEWIRQRLKNNQTYGEALAHISSSSLSQEDKTMLTVAASSNPWQPRDAVQYFAPMANCDGALVMTRDLAVLGFGAKITVREGIPQTLMLYRLNPLPGPQRLDPCPLEDLGGMRHQSAARFVAVNRDAVSIVISQDRRMSILHWSDDLNGVIAVQHAEWWA